MMSPCMKSTLLPLVVFFASLALNWSLKNEFPEKNGEAGVYIFHANSLLAAGLATVAIIFLRQCLRIVKRTLTDAGLLNEAERVVSWRYALLAPLPCLFMFRYSWMTEDGKRLIEYGGSTNSTLAYIAGVAALLMFQLKQRLSRNSQVYTPSTKH